MRKLSVDQFLARDIDKFLFYTANTFCHFFNSAIKVFQVAIRGITFEFQKKSLC